MIATPSCPSSSINPAQRHLSIESPVSNPRGACSSVAFYARLLPGAVFGKLHPAVPLCEFDAGRNSQTAEEAQGGGQQASCFVNQQLLLPPASNGSNHSQAPAVGSELTAVCQHACRNTAKDSRHLRDNNCCRGKCTHTHTQDSYGLSPSLRSFAAVARVFRSSLIGPAVGGWSIDTIPYWQI